MKNHLLLTLSALVVAGFAVAKSGDWSRHETTPIAARGFVVATSDDRSRAVDPAPQESRRSGAPPRSPRSREQLLAGYPLVPRDQMVNPSVLSHELIAELKARYVEHLTSLHQQVRASGARMVVAYLTPEFEADSQKALEPFIRAASTDLGLEYVDLTSPLRGLDPTTYTQMPRDGHWSARGASIVASALGAVVARHRDGRAPTAPTGPRPRLFGDLEPGQDVILDGGKRLPYRLQTNSQGLRMREDLAFPKTRPRVLILGDSQVYCPFLDNELTIPAQLQALQPDSEIIGAAHLAYGLDDLASLYRERARFVDPDLVIVQTGGGDVLDLFFSHRNLFSRSGKAFEPTELEARYYATLVQ